MTLAETAKAAADEAKRLRIAYDRAKWFWFGVSVGAAVMAFLGAVFAS